MSQSNFRDTTIVFLQWFLERDQITFFPKPPSQILAIGGNSKVAKFRYVVRKPESDLGNHNIAELDRGEHKDTFTWFEFESRNPTGITEHRGLSFEILQGHQRRSKVIRTNASDGAPWHIRNMFHEVNYRVDTQQEE